MMHRAVRCAWNAFICPYCWGAGSTVQVATFDRGWCQECAAAQAPRSSSYIVKRRLPSGHVCRTTGRSHWWAERRSGRP